MIILRFSVFSWNNWCGNDTRPRYSFVIQVTCDTYDLMWFWLMIICIVPSSLSAIGTLNDIPPSPALWIHQFPTRSGVPPQCRPRTEAPCHRLTHFCRRTMWSNLSHTMSEVVWRWLSAPASVVVVLAAVLVHWWNRISNRPLRLFSDWIRRWCGNWP